MTTTVSFKAVIIGAVMVALAIPAMSFAATPSVTDLQAQYQTLMSRFEALKASSTASTTNKTSPRRDRDGRVVASSTKSCMATAVVTRDTTMKTVWTTFSASIGTALDARATALATAWNASSTNQGAINQAWATWKKDRQAAAQKLHKDRQAAWDAFRKTANDTCKVKTPKAEGLEKSGGDNIGL